MFERSKEQLTTGLPCFNWIILKVHFKETSNLKIFIKISRKSLRKQGSICYGSRWGSKKQVGHNFFWAPNKDREQGWIIGRVNGTQALGPPLP